MHRERLVLLELPAIGPADLSITLDVLLLWTSAIITFMLLRKACARVNLVPSGILQGMIEGLIELIDREILAECIGRDGKKWAGFITTLFFFILITNLIGIIPVPSVFRAATGNINVTAALAFLVFIITIAVNIRKHGTLGFLRKFVPSGLNPAILVIVVPVEIISWLARPLSLAVRLFANMMAGHALLLVFITLTISLRTLLKPLPYMGAVVMSCFEVFVCFIQAFIFTMLTSLYIKDAMDAPD